MTTRIAPRKRLFPLGRIVATPGALESLEEAHVAPMLLILRHSEGDWGDLGADDKALNDAAVKDGDRILSAYRLEDGTKIWVITEADRSSTCILLPTEY